MPTDITRHPNHGQLCKIYMKTFAFSLKMGLALLITAGLPFFVSAQKKPNIILILADDMGYSDLGCYGSEICTPNLDRLAAQGIRFKQFYNNSICAPTRASLLTGQYQHKAGVGYFDVNLGLPAYQGFLNRNSLTLAEVLKNSGYKTLMSGKWHIGADSLQWPNQRGFEKAFALLGGATSYFDRGDYKGAKAGSVYIENNKRITPKAGTYYFTDEITRHAVNYLNEEKDDKKPFFMYLAYTAPHWPLQALPEDRAKYKGRYDIGWDSLSRERYNRQVKAGLINSKHTKAVKDPRIPDWKTLTYDEQHLWKVKMEVYAAMVDRMDQGIGKVLEKLKEVGKDKNTLVIFISDNGAPAEDIRAFGRTRNDGPVGTIGSYESQGKNWSYASNTPLRAYKDYLFEGGIRTPFIAWFPQKIQAGQLAEGRGHIIDIAPTLYTIASASYPKTSAKNSTNPLAGKSLLPLLFTHQQNRGGTLFWERGGNRAVRQGNWKLVSHYPAKDWELYDISSDEGETKNLAAAHPDIISNLSNAYKIWAAKTGVVDFDTIKPERPTLPNK